MKKIIFLDVDGTLVDYENHLPASAVQAIRLARQNGHAVYICTGRSKAEVYAEIWDIGLDGMIGANGAYVEHQGQVLLHQHFDTNTCKILVDWLQQRNLEFYLESNTGLFASTQFEFYGNSAIQEYTRRKGEDASGMTVRKAFPHMIFGGDLYRSDVNKISFLLKSYQDFLDAKAQFPNLEVHTWGGKGETALFGDFGVSGINKATAISCILHALQMERSQTIAFGDAKIDIPMLEFCEIGVAMGSGGPEIKAVADLVTDAVDADGLYNGFAKLGLI